MWRKESARYYGHCQHLFINCGLYKEEEQILKLPYQRFEKIVLSWRESMLNQSIG